MKFLAKCSFVVISLLLLNACKGEDGTRSMEATGKKADEAIEKSAETIGEVSEDAKVMIKESGEKISETTTQVVEDSKEWTKEQIEAADAASKKAATVLGEQAIKAGEKLKQAGSEAVEAE